MKIPSPRNLFLLLLALTAILLHLSPPWLSNFWSIPSILDRLTNMPQKAPAPPNTFCSPKIPSGRCCTLLRDSEPCKQECRKKYVNRVTMVETKEFEECATVCLKTYREKCEVRVGK
ncbi:hypothetical protein BU16DRAFT_554260 [Lophium mytilinum]|uniref:Uncharacterized protein n=1 Tax=Lophium mytilinum TaxID=390894 RepID=A0A6A6RFE9_9PEZI|nr:hypothetical protein BU16DRAFT_554260 [Lophium mytilinum]